MAILRLGFSFIYMRVVIQRVSQASVCVDGESVGSIGKGLLVFLGVGREDEQADVDWLVSRIVKLRIFESAPGRMDLALPDIGGQVLVISAAL